MKKIISCLLTVPALAPVFGQAAAAESKGLLDFFPSDINIILVIIAALMLVPIWSMSNTFLLAARQYYREKARSGMRILLPLLLVMGSSSLFAQAGPATAAGGFNSRSMTLFLVCLIAIEFAVIFFFAVRTHDFIRKLGAISEPEPVRPGIWTWLRRKWSEMNFRPIEEEYKIDTGHSYDGIRELDNPIPAWFTTAFLLTILFAGVYLYRYHVSRSAPLQLQELKMAMAKADAEHSAYLAASASNIDERNVAPMTGADLEAGKKVFTTLCAACHKSDGGGLVGPNLTDDYWIHGGALSDIFKTIKYGVPEKGMISWKEQLTPMQMAQVANYITTLHGTNPPDAKEKQGTLYVPQEAGTAPDTTGTAAPADTTKAN